MCKHAAHTPSVTFGASGLLKAGVCGLADFSGAGLLGILPNAHTCWAGLRFIRMSGHPDYDLTRLFSGN